MEADVLILGAGLAGVSCAIGLLQSGLRVLVVESSMRLGGRAQSFTDPATGDTIDLGPHVLTNEHRHMLRLLDDLGTADQVVWRQGEFLRLTGPQPLLMKRYRLPAPFSLLPNLFRLRALSMRDLASNTPVVWRALRLREEEVLRLDRCSAEEFLRREGVTPALLDWFWRTASMTFMNVPLEQCSAGALLRVFRRLLVDNRFRFGFPARGLGELFVPAALQRLQAGGVEIRTRCAARRLQCTGERVTGAWLDDGALVSSRHCVSTLPPQDLAPLLPEGAQPLRRDLALFEPVPYVSSYLWFARKITAEQMWTRIWSPANLNYDFYDLSNIRPGWSERPSLLAGNIIHSHHAAQLADGEITARTVAEIAEFAPGAATTPLRHVRIHRVPMAVAAPHPGTEARRPGRRTALHGLLLAGDWTRTALPSSMESAVYSGLRAAEAVLEERGRPRVLTLPPAPARGLPRLLEWLPQRRRSSEDQHQDADHHREPDQEDDQHAPAKHLEHLPLLSAEGRSFPTS